MSTQTRNKRDVIGGAALAGLGLFMILYSAVYFHLGTFARMQPGMFPTILGYLLLGFGGLIALPAAVRLVRHQSVTGAALEPFEFRPFIMVVASIAIFAFFISRFGMIPAIFGTTAVATLADGRLGLRGILFLACAMSALVVLVFRYGFAFTIPLFDWPNTWTF